MAIPSRQIGQSTQANLLWQISKQLERLTCVTACGCVSTTTTTTTISYYYYSGNNCNSPLFSQVIRSVVPLSIDDVVLTTDGSCYTIGGVYVGPDYNVDYVSTETCFVDPCPTTTTTTTALCNYLYEGVLTVGGDFRGSGYQSGVGAIDPIDANFSKLFYTGGSLRLSITTDCYNTIDVYINGTKYTLIPDLVPGNYYLEVDPNPFPAIGETCIIQICPGELCP
jgi:hypothetical protein